MSDYIGKIPEDFDPMEPYKRDLNNDNYDWDFEAREKMEGGLPSKATLVLRITKPR